ncbi:MAG: hypothetical protein ABIN61_04350 [candidate division WOR-3 bacterium]
MYKLDEEIEKRLKSNSWSKEIAGGVLSLIAKRRKKKIAFTGSLFLWFFLFFVIGLNISKERIRKESFGNFISTVTESIYPDLIPEDIEEFISYSFSEE